MPTTMSDTEAMNRIHMLLDGKEWDSDTTLAISDIVQATGREIVSPSDHTREELIELLTEDWFNSVSQSEAFNSLLTSGHKGFENMTYSELLKDAQDANLLDEDDED